jgi:hypothetical protein
MRDLLEAFVRHDIDCVGADGSAQDCEPARDDFRTFFSHSQGGMLDAAAQIDAYPELRKVRPHPRRHWLTCTPELANLARVAQEFLGALTTSASVELGVSPWLARSVPTTDSR